MKHRTAHFAVILSIFILLLPGLCSADEKFRVGVVAPLSGALAEYGLAAQNGIELARLQHPELFNNIEFLYEDSQLVAKTAVSAFTKLRDSSRVSLVFNWGNPTSEAVAPLAEHSQLPLIGMTLDPAVAKERQYVIRSTNASADFSSILGRYLVKKGYRRVGVVLAENTYVQGLLDGLKSAVGNEVQVEVIDRYNIQDQDFRSSVAKIRSQKYDALGVFLISGQVSNFYRQLASQDALLPTFGTDFFESSTEIRLANGGMNGAVYPHLGVSIAFRDSYIAKYGNDYQLAYAGNSYDMAMVIGRLFNSNTKFTPRQIIELLRSVKGAEGVGGEYGFTDAPGGDPHFQFPVQLKKIAGEQIQTVID